jgi:hypothetical protein
MERRAGTFSVTSARNLAHSVDIKTSLGGVYMHRLVNTDELSRISAIDKGRWLHHVSLTSSPQNDKFLN